MSNVNNVADTLRLADRIERGNYNHDDATCAGAELHRLHAEHEEDQSVIAVWRGRTQRVEAQRDAMLEALKDAAEAFEIASNGGAINFYYYAKSLRATINAVEENK